MKRIGFVTCTRCPEITEDDSLAVAALAAHGLGVEAVPWDDGSVSLPSDGLVIRSTWNYHERPEAFGDWLGETEHQGVRLWNPAPLVRWNMHKSYLLECHRLGVETVPTALIGRGEAADLSAYFDRFGTEELVIKPAVSASAAGLYRARRTGGDTLADDARLEVFLRECDVVVQPLVADVIDRGEWSLVFFEGVFSHAALKRAALGDFRVQREWGGTAERFKPPAPVVQVAGQALGILETSPLYARIDIVESEGRALLMEMELIEPELFLSLDREAPGRFAKAIAQWV